MSTPLDESLREQEKPADEGPRRAPPREVASGTQVWVFIRRSLGMCAQYWVSVHAMGVVAESNASDHQVSTRVPTRFVSGSLTGWNFPRSKAFPWLSMHPYPNGIEAPPFLGAVIWESLAGSLWGSLALVQKRLLPEAPHSLLGASRARMRHPLVRPAQPKVGAA